MSSPEQIQQPEVNADQIQAVDSPLCSWRRRIWLRRVVVGACGFILLAFAILWAVCEHLVAPVPVMVLSTQVDLPVSDLSLTTDLGATVKGWWIAGDDDAATVVLLHPLRGSRLTMLRRAQLLHGEGYSVVMIDLQGHGESSGDAITMGGLERHSAIAAVQYARMKSGNKPVVVLGTSLGGAAFLLSQQVEIEGLILESVYSTISEATHNRMALRMGSWSASMLSPFLLWQLESRLRLSRHDLRPIDELSKLSCPVLMMSGSEDKHTLPAEVRAMFKQLAPSAVNQRRHELWLVDQAGHVDLYDFAGEAYERRVLGFLSRITATWQADLH
ncbi:MAG: alpha/beta fold hydrolase [Fuerstiella sp.]